MAAATSSWLDMKLSVWGALLCFCGALGAYYGQKEATSVALMEIKGGMILLTSEVTGLKASVSRMEIGRYTAADSARDYSWRDTRAVELDKRVAELELAARRKR